MDDWTGLDLPAAAKAQLQQSLWTSGGLVALVLVPSPGRLRSALTSQSQPSHSFVSFHFQFHLLYFTFHPLYVVMIGLSRGESTMQIITLIEPTTNGRTTVRTVILGMCVSHSAKPRELSDCLPACLPAILTDCGWVIGWLTINARINDHGEMIGFRFGCRNYSNSEKINYIERHRPAGPARPVQCRWGSLSVSLRAANSGTCRCWKAAKKGLENFVSRLISDCSDTMDREKSGFLWVHLLNFTIGLNGSMLFVLSKLFKRGIDHGLHWMGFLVEECDFFNTCRSRIVLFTRLIFQECGLRSFLSIRGCP